MGKYGVVFDAFATTTAKKTAIALNANAAGEEGELIEVVMTGSGSAAAADRQHRASVQFWTFATAGTSTSVTPQSMNTNGPAARVAGNIEYSAEGTAGDGVVFIQWGFNQRGGMRWAVPKGEGAIFNNDRTAKGLVLQVLSDAAGEVDGHGHWLEP